MPSRTRSNGTDATQDDVEMQDATGVESAGEEDENSPYEEFAGQRVKTVSLSLSSCHWRYGKGKS